MIKQIYWMGRTHVTNFYSHFPSQIQDPISRAAISICDPTKQHPHYPDFIRPILKLDFSDYDPKHLNGTDKIVRKKELEQIKLSGSVLPSDGTAQKILKFADEIYKRPEPWTLYINCEYGISRSTAIAGFLSRMMLPNIPAKGYATDNFENGSKFLTVLLNFNYSEMVKEQYRRKK